METVVAKNTEKTSAQKLDDILRELAESDQKLKNTENKLNGLYDEFKSEIAMTLDKM